MIINYINVFLNITALMIGLKPISMTSQPLNRDQACIERSCLRLKRELGRAKCKRFCRQELNHYFITDCKHRIGFACYFLWIANRKITEYNKKTRETAF